MRVVFLTHNYPRWAGDVSGGFLATLAGGLARRGIEVRYASARAETLAYRGTMQAALRAPSHAAYLGT